MAQNFTSSNATDHDAIIVSDIDPPSLAAADPEIADFIRSNGTSTTKEPRPRSANKRERVLRALDQYYGPLAIGQFTVSRVELHLMNARVHDNLLDIDNTNFRRPPQAFIDGLRLNPVDVESRIRASGNVGDHTIATLLFEIATHRSIDAGPLLYQAQDSHIQKIDRLLQAAQKLDIRDTRLSENVPGWVNKQKSKVVNSMGVGLQAFGIYSGLMGISDAMKKGDRTEAAISAGAVVTEVGSLIIERGLVKGAQELIENSVLIYQGFAKTQFGLRLSRAAGLIAGVLTLPFDIYFAIKALDDASLTTGKQALDHYVAAGLNLTSAALTLILGTAALAGFAHAGPVGIAAAAILIVGSQIYSAIRQVDDIDDYIELSTDERLVTGFLAFVGQTPPERIHDRYNIAVTQDQHSKMLTRRAQKWLGGQLKDNIATIVNGNVDVSLKASQVFWFEWDGEGRESVGSKEIKVPLVEDGDDTIDARNGIAFLEHPRFSPSRYEAFEQMLQDDLALQPRWAIKSNGQWEVPENSVPFEKSLTGYVAETFRDLSDESRNNVARAVFNRANDSDVINGQGLMVLKQTFRNWADTNSRAPKRELADPILMLPVIPRTTSTSWLALTPSDAVGTLRRLDFAPIHFPTEWNNFKANSSNYNLKRLVGSVLARNGYEVFPLTNEHQGPTLVFTRKNHDVVFFLKLGRIEGHAIRDITPPGNEFSDPHLTARIGVPARTALLSAHDQHKVVWLLGGTQTTASGWQSVFIIREG